MLHRDLDYTPSPYHALTVTMSGNFLVAGYLTRDLIQIYTLEGHNLGTLDLGLKEDKWIYGIQGSNDGLLHVCVGNDDLKLTDLYAYKVSLFISCPIAYVYNSILKSLIYRLI